MRRKNKMSEQNFLKKELVFINTSYGYKVVGSDVKIFFCGIFIGKRPALVGRIIYDELQNEYLFKPNKIFSYISFSKESMKEIGEFMNNNHVLGSMIDEL